jgi:hypothetical protein
MARFHLIPHEEKFFAEFMKMSDEVRRLPACSGR